MRTIESGVSKDPPSETDSDYQLAANEEFVPE
jgi:hypothetical protein